MNKEKLKQIKQELDYQIERNNTNPNPSEFKIMNDPQVVIYDILEALLEDN